MYKYIDVSINNEVFKFKIPASDHQTISYITKDWDDGLPIIKDLAVKFENVIQAGGHCGFYPLLYRDGVKHVFTFEPDAMNFNCLVENCSDPKIIKFNSALGAKNELVNIAIVSYTNTGMNKIVPGMHGITAYCTKIDSYNFPDVSVIHLDVEGYELEAVQGAKKTILKHRPAIIIEMTEKIEKIYDLMKSMKYKEIAQFGKHSVNSVFVYDDVK